MKQKLLLKTLLLLCALVAGSSSVWATTTYTQLTSISDIDESYYYVLGIDGTGFHYSGTSSWGLTALPTAQTPLYYILKKANDGKSFTAKTTISSTTYYLQVPTSNTFSMATSTGTNTDLIIGTTQVSEPNYAVANKGTTTRHLRINGTSGLRSYAGTTGSMAFFYKVSKEDPTVSFSNGSVNVGQNINLSSLFDTNSTGSVTYSITSGAGYASLDGSTLTGVAEGSVTVQASQAADYLHNAIVKTATITVNAAKTLSSIAITTAPTKIVYIEGECFDPTDMVVTATYNDASTANVTASCTFTPSTTTALTTSDVTVLVSYTENAVNKTANQAITVNPDPKRYATLDDEDMDDMIGKGTTYGTVKSIILDGLTWLADAYQESSTTKNKMLQLRVRTNSNGVSYVKLPEFSGNIQSITFSVTSASGTSEGADETTTALQFQADNTKNGTIIASSGSTSSSTKTIDLSEIVTKYQTGYITADGGIRIWNITVAYLPTDINVSVSSAKYATFSDHLDRDFSASGITVYKAAADGLKVDLTEIADGIVPANTGVVLFSDKVKNNVGIPVATTAGAGDFSDNEMVGINVRTMVNATASTKTNYILSNEAAGVGFYKATDGKYLGAHKAYLSTANAASAPSFLGFDGETTGINAVNGSEFKVNGEYFNLNGQRVAEPTKGLYIVNGKKVVIK